MCNAVLCTLDLQLKTLIEKINKYLKKLKPAFSLLKWINSGIKNNKPHLSGKEKTGERETGKEGNPVEGSPLPVRWGKIERLVGEGLETETSKGFSLSLLE